MSSNLNTSNVKTPCIGICSTGIGDEVCRGCKRFGHEVIHWNSYSTEQKQLVIDRLDGFLQQVVTNMLTIEQPDKLREQVRFQQVKVEEGLSDERWLYELLRCGAAQITDPAGFGFSVKPDWQRFSLEQIKQFLEQDFYTLSCAHYDRYISLNTPQLT